jgi:hypothetical protein
MHRKPWPLLVLAIIQFLSPLSDVLIGAHLLQLNPIQYLALLYKTNTWTDLIELLFLAPLAGVSVLTVKKWSYPVFMVCVGLMAYSNFEAWRAYPEIISFSVLLSSFSLNILLVSYFLLKEVRSLYFNPRLRWWESKPRYTVKETVFLKVKNREIESILINISEGGALLATSANLDPKTEIQFHFKFMGYDLLLKGEVVYRFAQVSSSGVGSGKKFKYQYGIQFVFTQAIYKKTKKLIRAFELLELERRPERIRWNQSFFQWVKSIFKQGGKHLLPEPVSKIGPQKTKSQKPTSQKAKKSA